MKQFTRKEEQQQQIFKRMELRPRATILLLAAILASLCIIYEADAQFFTKSSKSIPRMGRRSMATQQEQAILFRRALIDRLVDEYGPNLLEVLQTRAAIDNSREFASRNDQPIDMATDSSLSPSPSSSSAAAASSASFVTSSSDGRALDVGGGGGSNFSRDERSPVWRSSNHDASLAMRALNTNRLLQALSSGQPLLSYSELGNTSERRVDNQRDQQQIRGVSSANRLL